jgi:hypothetical protein
VVDDEAMGSLAGLMFVIGISLLVGSPIAWVMERILAASARTDPVFEVGKHQNVEHGAASKRSDSGHWTPTTPAIV